MKAAQVRYVTYNGGIDQCSKRVLRRNLQLLFWASVFLCWIFSALLNLIYWLWIIDLVLYFFQISTESQRSSESDKLVIKKSWDIALGPIKGVPMNVFLLYMSGNSISIFPIMMVGMMLVRQLKALWATNATFSSIEGTHAILQASCLQRTQFC